MVGPGGVLIIFDFWMFLAYDSNVVGMGSTSGDAKGDWSRAFSSANRSHVARVQPAESKSLQR